VQGLSGFYHDQATRTIPWDLKNGYRVIQQHLQAVSNPHQISILQTALDIYSRRVLPFLSSLREAVIHSDPNCHNLLVSEDESSFSGLLDFGDIVWTHLVNNIAIAIAYAILDKPDPIAIAQTILSSYHQSHPLRPFEIKVLFPLAMLRLSVSVVMSAKTSLQDPNNEYVTVSEKDAWKQLENLIKFDWDQVYHQLLHNSIIPIHVAKAESLISFLKGLEFGPITNSQSRRKPIVLDLSSSNQELSRIIGHNDVSSFVREYISYAKGLLGSEPDQQFDDGILAIGKYGEDRLIYRSQLFTECEKRTIHLGIDLFMKEGSVILCPFDFDTTVYGFADNDQEGDYGPTIVLEHMLPEQNVVFYTLYGHLSRHSLSQVNIGKRIGKGDIVGWIGGENENGGWPPHLHFQLILHMLGWQSDFPGVSSVSDWSFWTNISPDPTFIVSSNFSS